MSEHVIPGGKEKGRPLSEATESTLLYWRDRLAAAVRDKTSRNASADRERAIAMNAELERRQGKAPAEKTTSRAIQKSEARDAIVLPGSLSDHKAITAKLRELAATVHLITPATAVGNLPEGTEVAFSSVFINGELAAGETTNGDVYKESGKLALTKTSLDRLAQCAGITWIPELCARVDDRSDPRYVEYKAVGKWRLFDGTEHVEDRCRAVDLRDGSDEIADMTEKQLKQQRKFILVLAESKAKNRVVRSLGIKTSYTADELARPFVVARLMFTGRTDDAALRREFALNTQRAMIGSVNALYGSEPRAALPAVRNIVDVVTTADDDDDDFTFDTVEHEEKARPVEVAASAEPKQPEREPGDDSY